MSESMLLVQLQTIDLKLLKAASTLAAMPQHKRLETIELAKKKLSSEYNKIVGLRKDAELEVKDLESQHETYQKKEQETQERAAAETDYRAIQDYDQQLSTLAKALEKTSFKLMEAQKVLQIPKQEPRQCLPSLMLSLRLHIRLLSLIRLHFKVAC